LVIFTPIGAGIATIEARVRREVIERSENYIVILVTGLIVINYSLKVKFSLSY